MARGGPGVLRMNTQTYTEKLKKKGIEIEPIEEYQGSGVAIKHRCLKHGTVALGVPARVLSVGKIKCDACSQENWQANADRKAAKVRAEYKERLAAFGKVEALEEYVNATTKILHRCLVHGETQLAAPETTLKGQGLRCCLMEAVRKHNRKKADEAAERFYKAIEEIGRVEVLEPYVDKHTKLLCRCKVHGETHRARPNDLVRPLLGDKPNGGGLWCCRHRYDSYTDFAGDAPYGHTDCKVYVALINGAYLKPGIAKCTKDRGSQTCAKGFYRGYAFESPTLTRAEAWAIEWCLLKLSEAAKPDTLPEEYDEWPGRTELRLKDVYPATWYIAKYHELVEELAEIGWEELYLKYQEQTLN